MSDFINDISLEEIFMMLAVAIGLMVISLIFFLVVKNERDAKDNASPIQRKRAKILEKEQLPPNTLMAISEMNVLFELEDGNREWLRTKAQNSFMPGDEGELVFQGKKVIEFKREI